MEGYNFNGNLQLPVGTISETYYAKQDLTNIRSRQEAIYFPTTNMHANIPRPKRDLSNDNSGTLKYMKFNEHYHPHLHPTAKIYKKEIYAKYDYSSRPTSSAVVTGSAAHMVMSESHEMHSSMDPELKYLLAPEMVAKYSCPRCTLVFSDISSLENHATTMHGQLETSTPVYETLHNLTPQLPLSNSVPSVQQQTSAGNQRTPSYVSLLNAAPLHGIAEENVSTYSHLSNHISSKPVNIKDTKENLTPDDQDVGAKPNFNCSKCFDSFPSNVELEKHSFSIHGGKFKCCECTHTFHEENKLNDHISTTHVTLKPFQCIECDCKFSQKMALKEHVEMTHRSNSFDCQDCGLTFSLKVVLRKHYKLAHSNSKKFNCQQCKSTFNKNKELKLHMEEEHHRTTKPSTYKISSKKPLGRPRGRKSKLTKSFKCKDCRMNFSSKKALNIHIDEVHIEEEQDPIDVSSCPHCSFATADNKALTTHILIKHLKLKPFECTNKFSTKSTLDQHKSKVHKHLRPYVCAECDQSFGKKLELSHHFLSKHKVLERLECSEYSCPICGESFRIKRQLQMHQCSETKVPELSSVSTHEIMTSSENQLESQNVLDEKLESQRDLQIDQSSDNLHLDNPEICKFNENNSLPVTLMEHSSKEFQPVTKIEHSPTDLQPVTLMDNSSKELQPVS